jgi:hypothetical protein
MSQRRVPPPRSVEETAQCFRDANGQALAFVYCEEEPGAGRRRQRRQHRGAAAREQGVKPFVVCRTPEAAFASVGVVHPQLKPDRFPDEFLCLTPAICCLYPAEWLRGGSGPSPLNRWEIRKANESQMQSMVTDICISGLWSHAAAEESRRCLKFSPFTSRRRRSSASVRELLN